MTNTVTNTSIKISRPAVYTFVAAVAVYAVVLLTQPDAPTPTHKIHLAKHTAASSEAFAPEDLNAHFARYGESKRNPFQSALSAGSTSEGAEKGEWTLTGINIINGVPSALVENSTTGNSVFLHANDRWRGLRVASIGPGSVSFVNALGQRTSLSFRSLDPPPSAPGMPGSSGYHLLPLGTLPPLPVGPGNVQPLPPFGSQSAPKGN